MNSRILQAGKPVSGSHFIGRESELKTITGLLEMGQSIVLIAPRRFGKTSLLLESLKKIRAKGSYSAYVDVFLSPDINNLSVRITEAVLRNHKLDQLFSRSRMSALSMLQNLKLKAVVEDFEFLLGFTDHTVNGWELFKESLQFADRFATKHKTRIVCAFDEFGDIGKLNGKEIVKLFRSQIQVQENAVYIFSGSDESVMNAMFVRKNSPFFRFARILRLGYINTEEFQRYYDRILSSEQIKDTAEMSGKLLDFTKGHPYYSQLALQTIILESRLTGMIPDLQSVIDYMLLTEQGYLEKSWEELSSSRELVKVILSVVRQGSKIYADLDREGINVYRGLSNLMQKGIVQKNEENIYSLCDPLFELWIRRNIQKSRT